MREIKFRGKDILNGEWIKGYLFYDYNNADEYRPFITYKSEAFLGGVNEQQINENTIGQYTGLKDKKGKEIYEGDIVRFEDIGEDGYEYKEGFDFENEAQVIYEEGQVTLTNFGEEDNSHYATDGQSDILDEILRNGNCEVIGNIYENPELLKE